MWSTASYNSPSYYSSSHPHSCLTLAAWKTLKHHQDLIDNKPLYKELGDSLFKAAKGVEFLYHVNINTEDPYPAFNAPVTEIAIWTLKEGTDKAAA